MEDIINQLAETILGVHNMNKPMLTNSILMPYSVVLVEDGERKNTIFLSKGQLICVAIHHTFTSINPEGEERKYISGHIRELLDYEDPTHRILACYSSGAYNPMLKLESIKTNIHYYLKLN